MDPEEMIERSPFVGYLGIEITRAEEGYGEATLEIEDCHAGPPDGSIAHGGVISAFADTVAGTATLPLAGRVTPTIDLRIDYLNPANCERLNGIAEVRRKGSSISIVDVEITDESGCEIATARGVFKVDNPKERSQWEDGWPKTESDVEE
ncbi:PaaI family thioesterase [Natrinema gelatinilyticum]|uniref:PaaI family thioesterase n=1 Tax=Natrinema gelatinilyticum TaxID=2961571 RepID=UPI0020C4F26E|nr:PaaI family thioesterase [Natrinema gelatinilyticum]